MIKKKSIKLERCPFCGSKNVDLAWTETDVWLSEVKYCVVCSSCGANGPDSTNKNAAIKAWNTRLKEFVRDEGTLHIIELVAKEDKDGK